MEPSQDLRRTLAGGDRRSLGRSAQVLEFVQRDHSLIEKLVHLLWDSDTVVRMRAADVLEKLSRESSDGLEPFKAELLSLMAESQQQEIRWHLAAIVPRLRLNSAERSQTIAILESYLEARSSIVKTLAMQGLWELSKDGEAWMRVRILDQIRELTRTGSAAMRARGRKLLRDACF